MEVLPRPRSPAPAPAVAVAATAPVEVRPARPDEYAAVGALTVAAYVADGFLAPDDDYTTHLRDAAGRARAAEVLVALAPDGRVLGTVTCVANGGPLAELSGPNEAEFRMLAVAPDARGQGVGEALVRACLERARAAGRRRMVLSTLPSMRTAHRLYERLGFRRAPELDWQPRPSTRLLAYALDLGSPTTTPV